MAKPKKTTSNLHPMDVLLNQTSVPSIRKGQEIDAVLVSISRNNVLFNIGAKAHAVLGNKELKELSTYTPYLNVNDTVRVRIISEESKDGFPVVSMSKFFEKGKWIILKEKKEKEEEIEVMCGDYGKGGIFIDFMGIRGVIPKIQLTEDLLSKPEKLSGQKIKVKILEVDQDKNRLVVSQKASVLHISQKDLLDQFDQIETGRKYTAKILGTSEFGVFCEVNKVEGLIHISELSWEKVTSVNAYARVGEEIDVVVVEKNKEDLKLNLSIKRLSVDPWEKIEDKYPKEKELDGEIIRKERYGYFVRLEPGIEGLIHISKLTGNENYEIGQKIKAYVEKIDKTSRRMSLLLPQKEKPVTYR